MRCLADLVIKNANIITMDQDLPRAEAIAIRGDRILAVGDDSDVEGLIGPGTEIQDLKGLTVMPGFNDNHGHPLYFADSLKKVDCTGSRSIGEMFDRLQKKASELKPGDWIQGFGYDETLFAEEREPTFEEMNKAFPDNPIYVVRACLHVALGNELCFKAAGYTKDMEDPKGGEVVRDANGEFTGRLCDNAHFYISDEVIPPTDADELIEYVDKMSTIYNAYGITSGTDMAVLSYCPDQMEIYTKAAENGNLRVRIAAYLNDEPYYKFSKTGIKMPFGNNMFRYQGRKLICDGSGSGGTAKMRQPNSHDGKTGVLYYTQEEMDDLIWEAHSKGEQIAAHGIGDRTIEMLLNAYEKAQTKLPRPGARHRIEHCSFSFPDLIERIKALDICANFNPGFLYYFGKAHLRNYTIDRVSWEFPYKAMKEAGVVVSTGSDCNVTVADPRPIIYTICERKSFQGLDCGREQCVSMEDALYTYTMAGAYMTFDENEKGSLTPGKLADLIVVDMDPTANEPEKILDMQVLKTVLGGKTVFEK